MLRDNLVGLIKPMQISAGTDPLALSIQKQASDDRSLCLENPRPEGAESSLTENVTSPFQAEPAQKGYRQRRERRRHFGELVQMDGSFHDWLEGRGAGGCMMNMTDDATSAVQLRLGEEETIWAAANILWAWIEHYGVPQSLYIDWKNLYKRDLPPNSAHFMIRHPDRSLARRW